MHRIAAGFMPLLDSALLVAAEAKGCASAARVARHATTADTDLTKWSAKAPNKKKKKE